MSLKNYSREELEVTSMLELAGEILHDEQKAQNFNDLYNKVVELKGYTDEQKRQFIAQFYTDLTVDGRFLTIDPGVWGLKRWYPVEQMDEIVTSPTPKKKKKAKKKKKEEAPREEPAEGELDLGDDNVEILTNKFEDEPLDERDESNENNENIGFDDELDEVDDDFDDDDFDDSDDEEEDNN
ncbi:DNA-directed RNA polymerase subunit delta [Lentibacillus jeotgali]|uniref:DNA-directed RNA polymerase subunit delta n=1 Tax=Lentibacillus jeotgali TaxID=558169 RepID=UPI0002625CA6|nr:DNA-directed RNA polymerase subunit delta [Lentibacillus jeotgali]